MAKHTSYRGSTIDMDSMRRENEKVPAIGNMSVNAKGDKISGGVVTKTASQIARENHRVQTTIVQGQCDSCKSLDCTHRVEFQEVSLFGVNKTMRCLINGGEPMLVIDCDGYTKR